MTEISPIILVILLVVAFVGILFSLGSDTVTSSFISGNTYIDLKECSIENCTTYYDRAECDGDECDTLYDIVGYQ
jgi:hypothetical protein